MRAALSWSAQQTLDGHLWRTATATLLMRDIFMMSSLLVATGLYLWLLERLTSAPVALLVWAAGAVWGYLGTAIFLWTCSRSGWDLATTTLSTSDYGPSGGTAAVAALVVALMRQRLVTIGSAVHHEVADVEHLISFATVLLLTPFVLKRRRLSGALSRPPLH